MKEILKTKERTWYLVDEWTTKAGLLARIHKCEWDKEMIADMEKHVGHKSVLHDFHTGYVQVPEGVTPDENKLDVHGGVTFSLAELGMLDLKGKWIGFDMAHFGDEDIQGASAYAKEECEKLAEQISKTEHVIPKTS